MVSIACCVEQITPQWLTNALRESGHLSDGTDGGTEGPELMQQCWRQCVDLEFAELL